MWYWVQAMMAVAIAVVLVVLYRAFLSDLLLYLLDHLGQTVILVLIYLIAYAQVGGALGVPYLFWNEEPVTRFFALTMTRVGPAWKISLAPSSRASWASLAAGMSFMSRR